VPPRNTADLHDVFYHEQRTARRTPREEDLVAESQDGCGDVPTGVFRITTPFSPQAVVAAEGMPIPRRQADARAGKPGYSVLLRNFSAALGLPRLGAPVQDSDTAGLEEDPRDLRERARRGRTRRWKPVLKASRRAYPAVLLADDNLWMNLQRETQANMALSPDRIESSGARPSCDGDERRAYGGFPMFHQTDAPEAGDNHPPIPVHGVSILSI